MTAADTRTPPDSGGTTRSRRRPSLGATGRLVSQRVSGKNGLQSRYLHNEAQAREQMAALRGAVTREPGEVPATWALTQVRVPDDAGDAPTREEIAVHTAMTLYAVHQQSRTIPMFRPGVGLGRAARELVGWDEENPSAQKRFNALVTSTTVAELRHHLRGFVSLLRARDIALDHAMLADSIVRFQRPNGAKQVRLAWARQYYSLSPADDADAAPRTDHNTTTPTPEN